MKHAIRYSLAAVSLFSAMLVVSGCSTNSAAPASSASADSSVDAGATDTSSATGAGAITYTVSQEVQDTYFKAICVGPGMKLGMGGTFDAATKTCTDPSGVKTTQSQGLAALLRSTPDEMRSSTQFMVVQVDKPVAGCSTADEYSTVVDLTITNACVENAMIAMSEFMTS